MSDDDSSYAVQPEDPLSPRSVPTLGRIALKRVPAASRTPTPAPVAATPTPARRAASAPAPAASPIPAAAAPAEAAAPDKNTMNRLVPFLDLFGRLDDEELARLAGVGPTVARELRKQVDDVNRALDKYVDLLDRLSDEDLVRLTGATGKTIRFWRLCQPRKGAALDGLEPSQSTGSGRMGTQRGIPLATPKPQTPPPPTAASPPPAQTQAEPADSGADFVVTVRE